MLKIEIDSEAVITRSGTSERTGKDWKIQEQKGFIFLPDCKYPKELKITLEDDAKPYAKGLYTISPHSFRVGRFEQLEVNLRLVPIAQTATRPPVSTKTTTVNNS